MSTLAQAILAAAGILAALGVLWRGSKPLRDTARMVRLFLLDWLGEPARPGVDARPSFPQRMAEVEHRTHLTERRTADLAHTFRGEVNSHLALLARSLGRLEDHVNNNGAGIDRLDARIHTVEERITDHRRRNDEQIAALRAEVDRRLSGIQGDLLRAETYRAALHELGLDIDPPRRIAPPQSPPFAPLEEEA